jgi:hypothetical protein
VKRRNQRLSGGIHSRHAVGWVGAVLMERSMQLQ